VQFIILVVPGFWAIWIYSAFLDHGTEDKSDSTAVKAIAFAVPGYLLATTLVTKDLLIWWLKIELWRAELFLYPAQFICSATVTILLGLLFGVASRYVGSPAYWLAKLHSKITGYPITDGYENGFEYAYNKCFNQNSKTHNQIAFVYKLGDEGKAVSGEVVFCSTGKTHELVVNEFPKITCKDILSHADKSDGNWVKVVNADSGVVTEIVAVKKTFLDGMYADQMNAIFSQEQKAV